MIRRGKTRTEGITNPLKECSCTLCKVPSILSLGRQVNSLRLARRRCAGFFVSQTLQKFHDCFKLIDRMNGWGQPLSHPIGMTVRPHSPFPVHSSAGMAPMFPTGGPLQRTGTFPSLLTEVPRPCPPYGNATRIHHNYV